jgi:hypothetical protein
MNFIKKTQVLHCSKKFVSLPSGKNPTIINLKIIAETLENISLPSAKVLFFVITVKIFFWPPQL